MKKYQHLFKIFSNLVKPLMLVAFFLIGSITNSVFAQDWNQIIKVVASDRGYGHEFGYSVSISGDYAIVGTNQANYLAGSAYIFKNNAGTWSEIKKIVASDREANDLFGYPVSISGDYAIVGAYWEDHNATGGNYHINAGSAYIFKNNAGTWSQVQKIVASDRWDGDLFGSSVAISDDYAIVGAYGEDHNDAGGNFLTEAGSAYIFKNIAGTWYQVKRIVASDGGEVDLFGSSVSISGDYAIVGAWGEDQDAAGGNYLATAGSAYVFKNNAETWSEVQKIVASDREAVDMFGSSVVISGDYAIVGAVREDHDATGGNTLSSAGSAYIFKYCLSTSGTDVQTACDSFTWINNVTYTTSNNTATYTLINAAGCDSLVTLNLTINNSSTGTDVQTACDSFTWINNVTYTASNNTATYTLTNAAGCDSVVTLNLTISYSNTGTDLQTACNSFTWINNVTYTASNNTATYTLTNAAGCDSVVTLNLTINRVSDVTTSTNGVAIRANNASATYQWLDCDNNYAIINSETGQTFTATASGNYAVKLTENGCVDTSACVAITIVGILENSFGNALLIYPNPTIGNFTIDLGAIYENAQILITDISGKLIDSRNISQSRVLNLFIEEPAGIYIVSIQAGYKKAVIRLVKE